MRRILCMSCVALGFAFGMSGCIGFLDKIRHDDGHISSMGGSAKARAIENDLNWGTSF